MPCSKVSSDVILRSIQVNKKSENNNCMYLWWHFLLGFQISTCFYLGFSNHKSICLKVSLFNILFLDMRTHLRCLYSSLYSTQQFAVLLAVNYNNLQGHDITGPSIKWIRQMTLIKKYSPDSGPKYLGDLFLRVTTFLLSSWQLCPTAH